MEGIDRKFIIFAINPSTGKTYTHHDALLLCAKDVSVPDALETLRSSALKHGADTNHGDSLGLLRERVLQYQADVHSRIPDTVGAEIARCIQGKTMAYTGNEANIWEPVEDLMVQALDRDCNPMKEGELEPDERQEYGSTVVGFDLDDPEGCRSIMDMTTGEGREADEALARLVVTGLQLLYKLTNPMYKLINPETTTEEKLPEGCPGDCPNHHGLCVGDEDEKA
jgi:hypothetical protein